MATFPLADLLTGIKSIGVRLKAKKADNTLEDIKTNDSGALKVDGQMSIDQTTDGTTNKVSATQATHDNFNANANLQVGDADVSTSNPVPTTLTGSSPGTIPEYGWLDTDDEPTPLEPTKLAFGVEINTTTHAMTTKYWNGTVWQEVL
jgi:hypothetical protein